MLTHWLKLHYEDSKKIEVDKEDEISYKIYRVCKARSIRPKEWNIDSNLINEEDMLEIEREECLEQNKSFQMTVSKTATHSDSESVHGSQGGESSILKDDKDSYRRKASLMLVHVDEETFSRKNSIQSPTKRLSN